MTAKWHSLSNGSIFVVKQCHDPSQISTTLRITSQINTIKRTNLPFFTRSVLRTRTIYVHRQDQPWLQ